ncbi:HlyD family efflux transporter periplasmic adaptor subunit [Yoonia sp.]|jgi:adhesin transport system membrane fusion protein|uniref:HlyD family efflux transporter periplasmic adaptor subunit n=1 Tax=Yoonia sp. TaxID=2212373 RepID=UPI00238918C5|nr:HlyD family efflux transporter periplasmic adaptor subunit [Yoonia sp.]MDE0850864.1 HlyD family efflux transporter periplasmic adaptor subunit [Yoonia sp.]
MATVDAEFSGEMNGSRMTIWLVGLTVIVFILWAKFAFLDEIVRAEGEVVSASRPQIIQNLEGGILAELLVSEGDAVEQGDIVAKLRGTNFLTIVADLEDQVLSAEVRRLRLEAEIAGAYEFAVSAAIEARSPNIVASERALLAARQTDYASKVEGARRVMVETQRELTLMEDMLSREIVALIEATKARKAHADAEIRFNEIVTGAELDRAAGYSETLQELAKLGQGLRQANDQLSRTIITSPMRGIVNNLSITTIGGVVRPGEEIAQITPLGDELFVEARVRPQDVANVVAGQRATIKFSAYDFMIYGSMTGEVQFVSADTFKDERRPDAEPHFKVTLRVDRDNLDTRQSQIAMRPGLQATVELHTGEKSVLQYLTKPLYRSREALQEP